MKYLFKHANFNDFDVFEDNKLPARAYFVPFSARSKADAAKYTEERILSDKITMLNGEWDFKYFDRLSKVPGEFDTETEEFDKINVPSMWQYTGYEPPFYANQHYTFEFSPPLVPEDCPVGIYRKEINIKGAGIKRIITFLGAISNIELYINGKYAGYSEGAHNTAEFDITELLKEGKNEVVVLVYKYATGSYLECQDMFRNNGIFRDVYITELGESHIWDFEVHAPKTDKGYNFNLTATAYCDTLKIALEDKDGNVIAQGAIQGGTGQYKLTALGNIVEWNAEKPVLYYLYLSAVKGNKTAACVRQEIGFKDIKIEGPVFYLNGKAIKLKGVNHHDTDESKGYYMTPAEIERDVKLMKDFNVNCVRTSHYPPDPLFIKLANHYGLYVIDEADIETHGVIPAVNDYNRISNNLKWKHYYWDRVYRMYMRDRNNASIIMWSYGNEAGGYKCQDYCNELLNDLCPDIPKHYEGLIHTSKKAYDVTSEMYPHIRRFDEILDEKKKMHPAYREKPYFLCEYAHAMGLGPGGLEEYWQKIYSADRFLGGCIWEFADHAVLHKKGEYKYTYGGDHGEFIHDGNFCVDGLFYPDRTPSTGAFNMRAVYRPLRITRKKDNVFEIFNTNAFTNADEYGIKWSYFEGGEIVKKGSVTIACEPLAKKQFTINELVIDPTRDSYINFDYVRKSDKFAVAEEQVVIAEVLTAKDVPSNIAAMRMQKADNKICIEFAGGNIIFNMKTGDTEKYNFRGCEYIKQNIPDKPHGRGFVPSVTRAFIDNDINIAKKWKRMGLHDPEYAFERIEIAKEENCYRVKVYYAVVLNNKKKMSAIKDLKVYSDGTVDVEYTLKSRPRLSSTELPRFGASLIMQDEFDRVEYYGLGEKENYGDFNAHARLSIYTVPVSKFEEKYIMPQESGNRGSVRWAKVVNESGEGLLISAVDKMLNIKASKNYVEDFMRAKHREDLRERSITNVSVDGFIYGIGSNSCGPEPFAPHTLKIGNKPLSFKVRFKPIRAKTE